MSYKLGTPPSPRPSLNELADFIEIECLLASSHSFSVTEAAQQLGIVDDESTPEDEEVEALEKIRETLSLLEDRRKYSSMKYPFRSNVSSVELDENCIEYYKNIYIFLLLSTRENMKDSRLVGTIDGTKLFERLCSEVLKSFFGGNARSFVFGTGKDDIPHFSERLQYMLDFFQEKGYRVRNNQNNWNLKDAGIDVVVFIPFVDERHGHFVCFAQCKTGTSWDSHITDLQPSLLLDYIDPVLTPSPEKVFLIADDYQEADWRDKVNRLNGLLFDRCRIMSFLPDITDAKLLNDIQSWNEGVLSRYTN